MDTFDILGIKFTHTLKIRNQIDNLLKIIDKLQMGPMGFKLTRSTSTHSNKRKNR